MSNRIFGALCVLLAASYVYFAGQTEVRFLADPIGPKFFPYVIGALLGGTGLAVVLGPSVQIGWPSGSRLLEISAATALMVLYTVALPVVGFVTCSTFAAGYLSWRMGATPIAASVAGLVTALTIFFLFHHILKLTLAVGPLGF